MRPTIPVIPDSIFIDSSDFQLASQTFGSSPDAQSFRDWDHQKGIELKLSGSEVYYTACSLLVTLKNSCSEVHCQRVLIFFFICNLASNSWLFLHRFQRCSTGLSDLAVPPMPTLFETATTHFEIRRWDLRLPTPSPSFSVGGKEVGPNILISSASKLTISPLILFSSIQAISISLFLCGRQGGASQPSPETCDSLSLLILAIPKLRQPHVKQSVFKVVLQRSTYPQIRQHILYYY